MTDPMMLAISIREKRKMILRSLFMVFSERLGNAGLLDTTYQPQLTVLHDKEHKAYGVKLVVTGKDAQLYCCTKLIPEKEFEFVPNKEVVFDNYATMMLHDFQEKFRSKI